MNSSLCKKSCQKTLRKRVLFIYEGYRSPKESRERKGEEEGRERRKREGKGGGKEGRKGKQGRKEGRKERKGN